MTYFSDLIKNVSKSFICKLYEIAKQYSTYISLTQVEESAGLSPVTYKLNLGSRHTHGKFRKEKPTHAEATQTETTRIFSIKMPKIYFDLFHSNQVGHYLRTWVLEEEPHKLLWNLK